MAGRQVQHARRRARGLRRGGAAGDVAGAGPALRLQPHLQAQVPVRQVQHRGQARARQLRRHRQLLLPDFRAGERDGPRRDRHGVHGQLDGPAGGAQHQRVGQRRWQEGAPVLPVVRPGRRLPPLHHHLEPQEHHLPGGRRDGARVPALRGPALPGGAAHGGARHLLGRQLLGHAQRRRQDRLVQGALRHLLPGLRRARLRRRRGLPRRQRPVDGPRARRRRPRHRRMGQAQLHELQLLRRRVALPQGVPRRVQAQLMSSAQLLPTLVRRFRVTSSPVPDSMDSFSSSAELILLACSTCRNYFS